MLRQQNKTGYDQVVGKVVKCILYGDCYCTYSSCL